MSIKVLDCTLRDGGYVNHWEFRYNNICDILSNLTAANIDYVECGFFKPLEYEKDKSLFSETAQLQKIVGKLSGKTKYTLMINYGEYDIKHIPQNKDKNILFRIAFKKDQWKKALAYSKQLKEKGYDVFVNPMHTNTYSTEELIQLIKEVNKIKPYAFTIVDTTGAMREREILSVFYLVDNSLDTDIALCFHSHNNLQLSFSNAQCLMKLNRNRELIIDSTVFGMGRGAGNLCTELLTEYLNDNYGGHYDIVPILKIVDEQINPIFASTPWGYSVPYYLAAINHCHPNYAKYLIDRQTVPVEIINKLLSSLPVNKKSGYDEKLIKQIYLDNFSSKIDDKSVLQEIKELLKNRNILVLAPGQSLKKESSIVSDFISKNDPFIISLNFVPEKYKENLVFMTNMKRFAALKNCKSNIVVTSNIEDKPKNAKILNYSSYLNNSKMYDNVALMFFKLLIKIGVKQVYIAGLDGFSKIATENYVSSELVNNIADFKERNEIISEQIAIIQKSLNITPITTSVYFKNSKAENKGLFRKKS